jgi:CubicO group peptidase (beta-lactamase class C family)/peptidoglycan/LPS O-acetylase OafA/YrhL
MRAAAPEVQDRHDDLAPPGSWRDPALDLLRTVALIRVVLWHALAAPWMTYFAAMPALFFVAGTLLAASGDRRTYPAVVLRRCRRLLPPLWLFGAVVAVAGGLRAGIHDQSLLPSLAEAKVAISWVIPVVDPRASDWHGGWLSTHLWYVRAYLWVLLAAPLFAALARRLRLALPLLALGVAVLELAARQHLPVVGDGTAHVLLGDVLTYGAFVVLGMAYQGRRRSPGPGTAAAGAAVATAATVVYAVTVGLPAGGVNDSYPAVALTGMAWLLALGAAESPIRRLASAPRIRRATLAVNRRAVTIYLWHPAAIVVAYVAVERWEARLAGPVVASAVVALALLLTTVAVIAVGWAEDVAVGRPLQLPMRVSTSIGRIGSPVTALLIVAIPLVVLPIVPDAAAVASGASRSKRASIPPPSYRAALGDSAFARRAPTPPSGGIALQHGQMPSSALQAALDRWMADQSGFDSVAVAVAVAGRTWAGDAHRPGATALTRAGDDYGVASVTKTFTVALVLSEVAAGRIGLDAPVPALPGVGRPPAGAAITPRLLLQHASGLVDYGSAAGYDPKRPLTPTEAVRLSLGNPLLWPPGEGVNYANSNYLYLGLLLEHVTGQPYEKLLESMVKSLGLARTRAERGGGPGWTGFSSGGIRSTVIDLARWGAALFAPGGVLPDNLVALLTTLDDHNVGLGTWPLCPCWTDDRGEKRYTAIGQNSGHGGLYYFPEGMILALHMEPPVEGSDTRTASLGDALLRVVRSGRPTP